ncbi:bifunctional diguanylate cyclase/phosphodiesterase [Steroidobacter cummioxidans]|uniref:bifunctional diguanylate cyclase/phosphodiesterase n=1 Tax=Steroidobacter cummioxidans TaxID=1803913 RepID=UPI000E30BE7D|nr:bifunctional diguanylate cyclase/phosphodiesterase [Steroidobacter cummioxidans]
MDSAVSTIRQFLIEAQRRIGCHAVAFTAPTRGDFHFHCPSDDAREVEEMLRGIAATFLSQTRETNGPVIRNRVRYENGGPMIGRFLVAPVFDSSGDLAGLAMMYRLCTHDSFEQDDLKKGSQLSRQLAHLLSLPADPVTGLISRAGLEELVDWRLKSLGERANSSVLYGDIDQLRVINDMFGFEAGDRAIAVVANALAAVLANEDAVLSRLSGDRFTVFLPDCPLPQAQKIAARLREAVQARPLHVDDDTFPLSICLGAATLTNGERSFDHSLAAAEVACKAAKERGRNRVEVYRISDTSMIRRRDDISIVSRLRSALDQGHYQIFGQPIASLLTRDSVHRYEMLLRIIDEKGRLVLPSHFMSSATRYQLLPQIDRCVIVDVFRHLRSASARPGYTPLHVSINLSGPTIGDDGFLDWLQMQLDENGVSGEWLTFELTETAAVSNMEQAQLLMSELGARGCRFALDDFGTGLSSLTHLKNLQFTSLKIDGSFIRDLLHNERSQSLVGAIAQLAGAMGMETIAEYVETPEICMRLIDLEVQYGQGYAIGKPRPLNGILAPTADLLHAS